jgi:Flp pilus assembly protein TadG
MPKKRRGTALVEFALTLPLLLSLLIGIVDVAFLYNHQLMLTNAAREGARVGALGRDATQIQSAITAYLTTAGYKPLPPQSDIVVALNGGMADVTVRSTVPFLFAASGPAVTIRAVARMRRE